MDFDISDTSSGFVSVDRSCDSLRGLGKKFEVWWKEKGCTYRPVDGVEINFEKTKISLVHHMKYSVYLVEIGREEGKTCYEELLEFLIEYKEEDDNYKVREIYNTVNCILKQFIKEMNSTK